MPSNKGLSMAQAKQAVIDAVAKGATVTAAVEATGRSRKSVENWRAADKEFAAALDNAKLVAKSQSKRGIEPADRNIGFAEWRRKYLNRETYPHQQAWIDLLEGRGYNPRPGETFIEGIRKNRLLINTPPFHAKALALDTPVMTPFGWSTIGDLRVGQQVYGPDGKPTTVTAKSEVFSKPCFRVVINDGEEFVASEDHLWTIKVKGSRQGWREETLTTAELHARGGKHVLPAHDGLVMDEVDYILDPYLLGAWLGDGTTSCGNVTSADPEIIDEFVEAGFKVSDKGPKKSAGGKPQRAHSYAIHGLFNLLAELGVKGRKFVPEGYLLGSFDQRLALLQGLMDTDGTVNNDGQCSFTNMNRDLAEGVWFLASSLGERPTLAERRATLDGRDCGTAYTVTWTPQGGEVNPFRLERKAHWVGKRLTGERRSTVRLRRITAVEPVEAVPTQCITVDNDSHLFLVGKSLVPTHNSTTITQDYVTYRICMNPNVRVIIVSKKQEQAKKFLYAIKQRLTSTQFSELQAAFAPEGGFKGREGAWSANMIYVAGRDSGEKDPTVEALGIGGQIYGARADLIVLDDCVTLGNANEFEKQIDWINQEVSSRLKDGKLLVVGTRVAAVDLYSELMNSERYLSGRSPWTYLAQPAVLSYADDPKDWDTLWPRSTEALDENDQVPDEDGLYRAWDGPALSEVREAVQPRTWSLVYMQQSVSEDAVFHATCVQGSVNRMRKPGPLHAGAPGHPRNGREGMYVIGSIDPATSGESFVTVAAVDRNQNRRLVLNCWVQSNTPLLWYIETVQRLTPEYGVQEWVIEKNYAKWLVDDPRLTSWAAANGIRITPTYTCVPTDVEILTREGWKTHAELAVGERVLTHLGWQPVKGVSVYPAPEKMYRIDSQNLRCDFTENHRHFVQKRKWGNRDYENVFIETGELNTGTPIKLTIDPVEGEGIGGDLAETIGWVLSEGSYSTQGGLTIYQSRKVNPAKFDRIRGCLDRLGLKYKIGHNVTADYFYIWKASAERIKSLLRDNKTASVDLIARMTVAERERFMEAMLLGDGHGDMFFSTSPEHIEVFEAACALNGYATSTGEWENGNGQFVKNKTCWFVRRKRTKLAHPLQPQHPSMSIVEGEGEVWCPTTPAGSWVARSKGRVFVTGNSNNKNEDEIGVMAMAPLFGSYRRAGGGDNGRTVHNGDNLIELPDPDKSEGVKALIEQLITWQPGKLGRQLKQDGPMSLWFLEQRAKVICRMFSDGKQSNFASNSFLSRRGAGRRTVVPAEAYRQFEYETYAT